MLRFLLSLFFALFFTIPALAKPKDFYPVFCDDLWPALKDTLGDENNYGIVSEDEYRQKALFVIVGALAHYTQKVTLTAKNGGCWANATIFELGPDNSDWRQFQHRLALSLVKLQAAKPKPATTATGQP